MATERTINPGSQFFLRDPESPYLAAMDSIASFDSFSPDPVPSTVELDGVNLPSLTEERNEGFVELIVTILRVRGWFPPLDGFDGVLGFFESGSSVLPIELDGRSSDPDPATPAVLALKARQQISAIKKGSPSLNRLNGFLGLFQPGHGVLLQRV